jgi:hypothetical protein
MRTDDVERLLDAARAELKEGWQVNGVIRPIEAFPLDIQLSVLMIWMDAGVRYANRQALVRALALVERMQDQHAP